jgi:hypothetical protein
MVAAKEPVSGDLDSPLVFEGNTQVADSNVLEAETPGVSPAAYADLGKETSVGNRPPYSLPSTAQNPATWGADTDTPGPAGGQNEHLKRSTSQAGIADSSPGRSIFFGTTRKSVQTDELRRDPKPEDIDKTTPKADKAGPATQIPFGTLLPVRLAGSIYTFRNSGGFVRMELTRPVEGKGYSYPAGTILVGNVRGGESVRAFVTIIGLIDPVSGEVVRFGGELLGRDGASGIEGRRRKLTSRWARFFAGLKDTATSVLGSVGAVRSGGTVILTEPMRRGSETLSEGPSDAILRNGKDDTFIEVSAGTHGYVLITGLPENSSGAESRPGAGANDE